MKTLLSLFIASLIFPTLLSATAPQVRFALAVHSEAPGGGGNSGVPETPDFRTTDDATYLAWRAAVLELAAECENRSLAWQFQCDWNFLEGVVRFETSGGDGYTSAMQDLMDATTAGMNVMKYLREVKQVNLDPHSHETLGYNYADVAYLLDVKCDTQPTLVVGGHVYDPGTVPGYQNWPKFLTHPLGLKAQKYALTNYRWRPVLLMGGGSVSHKADPHISGLWRPQDADHYFTHSASQTIAAVGNWEQDFFETDRLLSMLESGELPHQDKLWTVGRVLNHRDLVQPGYLTNTVIPLLDTIAAWRDAGRFQVKTFEAIYNEWIAAPYNGASSLYERPLDNLTFSLNWQDFCYTDTSNADLRTLLNLHETQRVPVDVFLTTWQTDILESEAPELLGRLLSSRWVNLAYHVRAPKPYAHEYTWRSVTSSDIATYETSRLNMVTGEPDTTATGGYGKLSTLNSTPLRLVGPNTDTNTRTLVHDYFRGAGVDMIVQHDGTAAVNLGATINGLNIRPENYDWKLIEVFKNEITIDTLDEALAEARVTSGSLPPYFIGVKLHDNDLNAEQSAWTAIYQDTRRTPNWNPTRQADWAALLTDTIGPDEPARRRDFYIDLVIEAASRRASINLMDARDTLSLLGEDEPRTLGLTFTEVAENQPAGTVLAQISGGGAESGLACTYELISGDGDTDNADFSISNGSLIAARTLDYEADATKQVRIRWSDAEGNEGSRALTLVLTNVDSDDDDGDGFTEAQETLAGTDSQSSASRLAVSNTARLGSQVSVTWRSVVNKQYQVQRSTSLGTDSWANVSGTLVTASTLSTTRTFTETDAGPVFYRVVLVTP